MTFVEPAPLATGQRTEDRARPAVGVDVARREALDEIEAALLFDIEHLRVRRFGVVPSEQKHSAATEDRRTLESLATPFSAGPAMRRATTERQ